jgi:hypothetical protein
VTQAVGRLTVWVDRRWGGQAADIGEGWCGSGGKAYSMEEEWHAVEKDVVRLSYRRGALLCTRFTGRPWIALSPQSLDLKETSRLRPSWSVSDPSVRASVEASRTRGVNGK